MNLLDYVKPIGAQAALAKILKVPPVLISQWANGKRFVPMERCVQIEQATCGAVTCEELRPDKADDFDYLRTNQPTEKVA
jgi:DNA-binding transcriptional regulator YdaS (Cro superfamily)